MVICIYNVDRNYIMPSQNISMRIPITHLPMDSVYSPGAVKNSSPPFSTDRMNPTLKAVVVFFHATFLVSL